VGSEGERELRRKERRRAYKGGFFGFFWVFEVILLVTCMGWGSGCVFSNHFWLQVRWNVRLSVLEGITLSVYV